MYQPRIADTQQLRRPNIYVQSLQQGLKGRVYDQNQAVKFLGQWRSEVFSPLFSEFDSRNEQSPPPSEKSPLDVELGTGNGVHLAARALAEPERLFVGLEVKYKPLIQSANRILRQQSKNAVLVRFHAHLIEQLFTKQEINNVYVHFSDPWVSPRRPERRILGPKLWKSLSVLQRPSSFVEFKTDSRELFDWVLEQEIPSLYQEQIRTYDLHAEEAQKGQSGIISKFPVRTGFENIFMRQGLPIHYVRWIKQPY